MLKGVTFGHCIGRPRVDGSWPSRNGGHHDDRCIPRGLQHAVACLQVQLLLSLRTATCRQINSTHPKSQNGFAHSSDCKNASWSCYHKDSQLICVASLQNSSGMVSSQVRVSTFVRRNAESRLVDMIDL